MMESSKEANFLKEGANYRTLILWRTEGAHSRFKRAISRSTNSKRADPRSEGTNARSM